MWTEEEARGKECKLGHIIQVLHLITVATNSQMADAAAKHAQTFIELSLCSASDCMMWRKNIFAPKRGHCGLGGLP